jgi:hypothetical protein
MTIIEGAEVDQALIDDLRKHSERLAALMPTIREAFGALIPALANVEAIRVAMGPLDDEPSERFRAASGTGPAEDLLFELHDMSDYDSVMEGNPIWHAADRAAYARWLAQRDSATA